MARDCDGDAGHDLDRALDYLGRAVFAQAYTAGFRDSFLVLAIVCVLGLIPAWITEREKSAASA